MNTPGEQLVDYLEQLRTELLRLSDRLNDSGVERTAGLGSHLGRNCEYYKKSMNKFLEKDFVDLRNLINQTHRLFKMVE